MIESVHVGLPHRWRRKDPGPLANDGTFPSLPTRLHPCSVASRRRIESTTTRGEDDYGAEIPCLTIIVISLFISARIFVWLDCKSFY
jgi:hypothetical protein